MTDVLEIRDLEKTFRIGFFRKRVDAVRGVSFSVKKGEVFGLLGPNGAGKTTTLKMVLRLIFPTAGKILLFGEDVRVTHSLARVGTMPENPYVYQYLKPLEFLDLCGALAGMKPRDRMVRAKAMIEKVGLGHATDRPIGKFSKGMTQRIGLAQALLHDPEFLILDEPMSGLDPIGRREVLELLLEQRAAGKTLLFTSHILSDVERLCDRVVILREGKIAASGPLDQLLEEKGRGVEIEVACTDIAKIAGIGEVRQARVPSAERHIVVVPNTEVARALGELLAARAEIISVTPSRQRLEALFVRPPEPSQSQRNA